MKLLDILKHFFGLTLVFIFSLSACSNKVTETPEKTEVPSVQTMSVVSTRHVALLKGVGTAMWRLETQLGFTTGGKIDKISVTEGEYVKKGQLLATLRTDIVGAEFASARAAADLARLDLDRIEKLYREGWVTKARFDSEQARTIAADANLQAKSFALETSRIVAPSNGVILSRQAEPSQIVAAGFPILILGETSGGQIIRVPVNDRIIDGLRIGQLAEISFDGLPGKAYTGRIMEIGGKASNSTGTFDVEVSLPSDPSIRSGLAGRVGFLGEGSKQSGFFLLPSAAIVSPRVGQGVVYVLDANQDVSVRTVKLGEVVDGGVIVSEGLKEGETIILTAHERLRDGMRVNAVPAKAKVTASVSD